MKKLKYIIPAIEISKLNVGKNIMSTSLEDHAGGVSAKDRDELEEEEAAAAADFGQVQKYSLW